MDFYTDVVMEDFSGWYIECGFIFLNKHIIIKIILNASLMHFGCPLEEKTYSNSQDNFT